MVLCFKQRMDNPLHGQNWSVFSEEHLLWQALTQLATLAIPFGSAQPQRLQQSESVMQPSRHWDDGQTMPTYHTEYTNASSILGTAQLSARVAKEP